MRVIVVLVALFVAVVVLIGLGDVVAAQGYARMPSVVAGRHDSAAVQAAATEWLQTTLTSPGFVLGVLAGAVMTEIISAALRWSKRTWGGVAWLFALGVKHRLAIASCIGALGWVWMYWVVH